MIHPIQKKIAIIIPNLIGGGAERVTINLANELSSRGFLVDLLLLEFCGDFISDVLPSVNIIDLKARRLRYSFIPLIKYFRYEKPDAVIANMWPLTGIAVIAKILSNSSARLMVVEHTNWLRSNKYINKYKSQITKSAMRHVLSFANNIVAVSLGAADDLAIYTSISSKKISTIYNPIVAANEQIIEAKTVFPEWSLGTHKKILSVGSLKNEKNYPFLLNSFVILLKNVNAKLLILGEGVKRPELESQIHSLGLEGYVFLPGFVKNPTAYMQQADLFVLSSHTEGFGNVLVESLQEGTPIVSTDCPSGPSEILSNGEFGLLSSVDDPEELANTMQLSLNSSHDKEALVARAKDFSIAKATDNYIALLFPECEFRND